MVHAHHNLYAVLLTNDPREGSTVQATCQNVAVVKVEEKIRN